MTVSKALGWALVHSMWQGALAAAALGVWMALVRSARPRYAGACLLLSAVLAAFVGTLLYLLPAGGEGSRKVVSPTFTPWRPLPGVSASIVRLPDLIPWLTPVWLAGVCMFYLRHAAGWLALRKIRWQGICDAPEHWQRTVAQLCRGLQMSRPVALMESLLAETPVVLGHFRPVILVPLGFLTGLPAEQVEVILLHELAHVRRSDYLINVCQRLVEGLLFYHPAVWWISRVIRTERENCCDDVVVNLRGDAHGYAAALTALEQGRIEQSWRSREPAVAATGGDLMKRVRRLLYPRSASGIWAPAFVAVMLMAGTAMVLSAWHLHADNPWQKWLNEDVVYIITDQEKAAFEHLSTDEERQHFVEQFWERRDPTPGTTENEFKEEHYRRITYANKHWATGGAAGWRSDRGRMYIKFGPPDEIDSHPNGGSYKRPDSEGGGTAMTYPFEDWRYYRFEGLGNLDVEFVDQTGSGELMMTLDPNKKYRK